VHVCVHICSSALSVCTCLCVQMHMCVCMHVWMSVCMCTLSHHTVSRAPRPNSLQGRCSTHFSQMPAIMISGLFSTFAKLEHWIRHVALGHSELQSHPRTPLITAIIPISHLSWLGDYCVSICEEDSYEGVSFSLF
jgi:hypothetical protein